MATGISVVQILFFWHSATWLGKFYSDSHTPLIECLSHFLLSVLIVAGGSIANSDMLGGTRCNCTSNILGPKSDIPCTIFHPH